MIIRLLKKKITMETSSSWVGGVISLMKQLLCTLSGSLTASAAQ